MLLTEVQLSIFMCLKHCVFACFQVFWLFDMRAWASGMLGCLSETVIFVVIVGLSLLSRLTALRELNISYCPAITDSGVKKHVAPLTLHSLSTLHLTGCSRLSSVRCNLKLMMQDTLISASNSR